MFILPWIFAGILLFGVLYLLFSLVFGGILGGDIDLDADVEFDGGAEIFSADDVGGEARGLGLSVIAAFMAGFGVVGLVGSLSGWNIFVILIVSVAFGYLLGRLVLIVLRYVSRQESTDVLTANRLIGSMARITVNTPAGQIGEALVESDQIIKYPVRNVADTPLQKGDYVEIVDVQAGRLFVKKKNVE